MDARSGLVTLAGVPRFRDRLVATLRAVAPILEVEGVLVVGSEVPNLREKGAASTLVVSQDVDIGVPILAHEQVKRRLDHLEGLTPSSEEPSVWVPTDPDLLEVNFVGFDPGATNLDDTRILEDARLPLMVFGPLSLLRPGEKVDVEGVPVPLPRTAGLILEKLVTDRTGTKGDRDLLVVLGMLVVATEEDRRELASAYAAFDPEHRHVVRGNLAVLSLLGTVPGMPDPVPHRALLAALLGELERMP